MRIRAAVTVLAVIAGSLAPTAPADAVATAEAVGSYAVDVAEYDLGDLAVELPALGARSEVRGRVYSPRGAVGKRPLVMFLHGFHEVCTGEVQAWPCPAGEKPVPSYRGYGGPAEALASRGYLVVSISSNAVNKGGGATVDRKLPAAARAWR